MTSPDPTDIPGWFNEYDFGVMKYLCQRLPKKSQIVEIGSFCGRSAAGWAKTLPQSIIYTIDNGLDWDDISDLSSRYHNGDLALYRGNNRSTLHWVMEHYPNIVSIEDNSTNVTSLCDLDLVFIDGEHTHEAVKKDLEHWYPRIRPGGILCGHDFYKDKYPDLVTVVQEFASKMQLKLNFINPSIMWWCFIPQK
jgi:Methyltransferase domain